MSKKYSLMFLLAAAAVASVGIQAAEPVSIAPEDVLFLAHFDQSLKPEKGNNDGAVCTGMLTSGSKGFKFAGSVRNEALDLSRMPRTALFPAKGNLDPAQGTLQMWVSPKWKQTGYGHCVFFQLVPKSEQRKNYNWRYLHIQKVPRMQRLSCGSGGKRHDLVNAPVPGAWFHLTLTWDKKADVRKFYLNGKLLESRKLGNFGNPEFFMLGAPRTWNAQAYIDEVRILRRVLTPAEVAQDYQAQVEGKRFPTPVSAAGAKAEALFAPGKITAAAGGVTIDADEKFAAVAIPRDFKVDGNLNKAVWRAVPALPYAFRTLARREMKNKSEIKLRYSPTAIYFGIRLYQDMSKVVARYDQDEQPIYNDDSIEIFLDTPGENGGFHQFVINSLGKCLDLKDGKRNYTARGRQIRVRRFKDRWDLEVKIPFAALGMFRPFAGDRIALRFCRSLRGANPENGALPMLRVSGNNRRTRLGALCFTAGTGTDSVAVSGGSGFFMGCNNLSFDVTNNQNKAFPVEAVLLRQDRAGNIAVVEQRKLSLPAKQKTAVKFVVNNKSFDTSKYILTIREKNQEIAAFVVPAGFVAAAADAQQLQERIRGYQVSLAALLKLDHPIYRGAGKNLDFMYREAGKFAAELQSAIAAGKHLSKERCETFAKLVAGFENYISERRYLLWQTSPWEIGNPTVLPENDYTGELKLDFKVGRNEREALCFIVSGLFCDSRLDLRVVPQSVRKRGDRKHFISCDNFEVYVEKFINHDGDIISAPLIRVPDNSITVTPGAAVRVWVVFNSRNLRVGPGTYNTEILIKHAYDHSVANRKIPVTVKLWDFALPETHEWPLKSFFWGPNYYDYDEIALLRMSHDYHITHGWSKSGNYTRGFENDFFWKALPKGMKGFDEKLVLNANAKFFEVVKELNMRFVIGWNIPCDPRWFELMAARMLKLGLRPDQFVFKALIRDEFVRKHIPQWADVRAKVSEMSQGKWYFQAVYLSTPPPTGATMDDIEAAGLPEFYKMWTVIHGLLKDPKRGPDVIRRLKAKGCHVWSYRCARYMQVQSLLGYYRLYPWECYMMGLEGVAFWTSTSPKGDDGFDHRDGYDEGVFLRGPNKTPVSSKRLEAFREGLEDVAYMDILSKELARLRSDGKHFPQYEKLLNERKQIIEGGSVGDVERWRVAVGEAINALRQK